jgi:feruloyl esterase
MKKTHDVAFVLVERAYGERPAFNYYVGGSQGGREGLTVAQRYPNDYDGVLATVPIVGFSSLMLAPALTRIQERATAAWVPPTKGRALLAEFMRQCDGLDARIDGIINNYVDCRALFDVNDGGREPDPWARLRCANDVDPNPQDASENACLTARQIETVTFVFSAYRPGIELANGRTTFGMWAPTTAVAGGGFGPPPPGRGPPGGMAMAPPGALFVAQRYRGQEGAAPDAPVFSTLGSIGVNGIAMQDLDANPLDFSEVKYRARREQTSPWLDSTDPNLAAFRRSGGKLVVIVGTDDTIAPSGEQLDYYQSMLDALGRRAVDSFARLYVLPQTGHGLTGNSAAVDGNGATVQPTPIPNTVDRFALLREWVENGIAPSKSVVVTSAAGSLPMCSYPTYPRYESGPAEAAGSYVCATPATRRR